MRRLAEENHVIWVNWHASRIPSIGLNDLRTITGKLRQIRRGPLEATEQITVVTPPQLPLPGSEWARKINASLVQRSIRSILRRLPKRPVQLWSFAPDIAELVGSFDEELVLYYCVDAFGEFPGYDRDLIEQLETALIRKSDVVLTTSQPLFEAKQPLHPNVHLVQHGVDHTRLSRAVHENLPIPEDLLALPKPVFGFVGVVGEWVDLQMVANLARMRPDASIAMIGPAAISKAPLADLPNVYWLGARNHEALPCYLRGFDVGLIPFCKVPLTHHANPIKLYEYLAAGVPVVSTSLPAVREVPGSVWLADDLQTFVRSCDEALANNQFEARATRSELMAAESWTARITQISEIVESTFRRGAVSAQQARPRVAPEDACLAASLASST
jgi:glycosyltransferase involved in cell wall biosynthesis